MNRELKDYNTIYDTILTWLTVILGISIILLIIYLYAAFNGYVGFVQNKGKLEAKVVNKYNYIDDKQTVIDNTNSAILEQFSSKKNTKSVSALAIEHYLYDRITQDGQYIDNMFNVYNNGYKNWKSSSFIFDNLGDITYKLDTPLNLAKLNSICQVYTHETGSNIFTQDDIEQDYDTLSVYNLDVKFKTNIELSTDFDLGVYGMLDYASTPHLEFIKVPIEGDKNAIFVVAKTENLPTEQLKQYSVEYLDIDAWHKKDLFLYIYPFKCAAKGTPGSFLNEYKENTLTWNSDYANMLLYHRLSVSLDDNLTKHTYFLSNKQVFDRKNKDTTFDYDMVYTLKKNFLIFIEDNSNGLIEFVGG